MLTLKKNLSEDDYNVLCHAFDKVLAKAIAGEPLMSPAASVQMCALLFKPMAFFAIALYYVIRENDSQIIHSDEIMELFYTEKKFLDDVYSRLIIMKAAENDIFRFGGSVN
jgi:hypothetical protein